MFDWERGIALHPMQGIGPHLTARGKSPQFSRVAAGTWYIFSKYGGDGHSKLDFVQQRKDSCLVTTATLGIYTRLGKRIQTLLEVRPDTKRPFLVGTVILGFLSIFKKSRALSFEALNWALLWWYQGM